MIEHGTLYYVVSSDGLIYLATELGCLYGIEFIINTDTDIQGHTQSSRVVEGYGVEDKEQSTCG